MDRILFRGGRVFDGESAPLTGHAVLVEGARVAALAPEAEFQGFAGEVVDTSGATLLPGLIDCHVHLCMGGEADPIAASERLRPGEIVLRALQRAQASLAGGITGLRDCGGRDYLEFAVRDACNDGRFLGPTIRAAGRMICMTGGHGNRHGRIADGADEVVKAVREQVHAGCDLVKLMATGGVMTPGVNPEDAHYTAAEMAAGIGEARRFHRRTASHAQGAEGILNAVRGGIDSIEHGIFMTEACVEEMLARGTCLVPTLAAVKHILAGRGKGVPAYAIEKSERVFERHQESVRMFYRAGGRIAMGTDAGTPFNLHGANAEELAFMVELGMTPLDALKSATSVAAELADLPDEGRIRPGAWADLLLVDGDAAAEIGRVAERAHHRLVLKRGQRAGGQAAAAVGKRQPLAAE